jgi:excisionase family DNA binding protein
VAQVLRERPELYSNYQREFALRLHMNEVSDQQPTGGPDWGPSCAWARNREAHDWRAAVRDRRRGGQGGVGREIDRGDRGGGVSEFGMGSPYFSVQEAADYLRTTPQAIYDRLSAGKLKRVKDGRRTLIERAEIERLLSR